MVKRRTLEDNVHGQINITDLERSLIYSKEFNRLHDIYQNSTLYMTFPTNRVKRFEHSIGVMYLSGKMFNGAIQNTPQDVLKRLYDDAESMFDDALEISMSSGCRNRFYSNRHMGNVRRFSQITEHLSDYRQFIDGNMWLIPSNVPEGYRLHHIVLVESARIAGLLHDVGHPPFSHITERALLESSGRLPEWMGEKMRSPRALHEQMGLEISEHLLSSYTVEEPEHVAVMVLIAMVVLGMLSDGEFFRDHLARIHREGRCGPDTNFLQDLHSIIDSSFDSDRLDYIPRDAISSGRSRAIDQERVIQNMMVCVVDGRYMFCPSIKTMPTIEEIFYSRFDGYVFVVYHHHAVKTNFIMSQVIKGLIDCTEQKEHDDLGIPSDITGLWWPMDERQTAIRRSYALCQWNDSWFMSMVKSTYFRHMEDGTLDGLDPLLRHCMEELVTNEKHIYTLIKRREHFRILDDAFAENLMDDELREKIASLSDGGHDPLAEFLGMLREDTADLRKFGFALNNIRHRMGQSRTFSYYLKNFRKAVEDSIGKQADMYAEFIGLKTGMEGGRPIMMHDEDGSVHDFMYHSNISQGLSDEVLNFPWFFLFTSYDCSDDRAKILRNTG